MVSYDADAAEKVPLEPDAISAALDAATEAHVAGLDNQEQLERAIQVYLLVSGKQ